MDNLLLIPTEPVEFVRYGLDQWIPLIAAVATALWTMFRGSDAYRSWRNRVGEEQFDSAIRAVEAGVQATYDVYVRKAKAESSNSKLTDDQRHMARLEALQQAVSLAPKGVDVIKVLGGHAQAVSVVEEIVQERKGKR